MAVCTGEQFLKGLRDGREVWLEGERVTDVTSHPKLSRMAHIIADIYDLQHSPEPWIAMRHWYPEAYDRVASIVQQLAASGLMLTPSEADLADPLAADIEKYYQGTNIAGTERVRLFRLAWNLVGTQFGSRQTLYERYFNSDVVQLRQRRYAQYDYSRAEESVRSFMSQVYGN